MLSFHLHAIAEDLSSDYDAIKTTIENYFEGFKHGDRARLEKAFAVPNAHMKGYIKDKNGRLIEVSRPINEVIDDWVSRDPSPDFKGPPTRRSEVLAVS